MRRWSIAWLLSTVVLTGLVLMPVRGDDWPTLPDWPALPEWPWRNKADMTGPNSLFQIARSLDAVEEKIRDDGVITTKQPDVWSQDSMTKYRKDFEGQMYASLGNFAFILSGRVTRSDQASFSSQTALAASLTPLAPSGGGAGGGGLSRRGGGASTAVTSPTTVIALPSATDVTNERTAQQQIANNMLNTPDPTINRAAPFAYFTGGKPFQDIGEAANKLGLEPNEYLDQKQSYLEHLNQLRRVNLGADNADAAGYGLYLVRMPVSIQPGECTYKGHGAVMTVTARHSFSPKFLPEAFRGFVINDLVHVLTPVIYEMNRSGYVDGLIQRDEFIQKKRAEAELLQREREQKWIQYQAGQAAVNRYNVEFNALKSLLAKNVGDTTELIVREIGAAIVTSLPQGDENGPQTADLRQAKLDKFNKVDRMAKTRKLREAIASIRLLFIVLARDAALQKIQFDLAAIDESLEPAERRDLTLADADNLEAAQKALIQDCTGLSGAIEGALRSAITATPQAKSVLSSLDEMTYAWDAVFVWGGPDRKRWQDLFPAQDESARKITEGLASLAPSTTTPGAAQAQPANAGQAVRPSLVSQLSDLVFPLADLLVGQDSLRLAVARLPAQIAAAQAQIAQINQQATVPFTQWVATFLPLTRTGTDYYPVAPTDYDNVFLGDNLKGIARIVHDARWTRTPRFSDVRTFLRREIEAAYDLQPYFEPFIAPIHEHIISRDFPALKDDYTRMAMALPGELRGQTREILTSLCWAVAVDAGLLNRQVVDHIRKMDGRQGFHCPEAQDLVFYWHDYLPEAPEPQVFQEMVRRDWPILAFSVDPFLNEQNIADASSVHRELQLALAFSFAAGRIGFNQLDRFTRRMEYEAETIALNRTISSFTQGKATFGWRFYPRFQNPPPEATNLHVLSNLLIKGGQGRNYQMDNSKLEAGQREMTAVVVMPSFVPYVRFESTGNWFILHDPEQLIVPTDRMLRQSQKVAVLQQELRVTEDCGHFREEDLDRLRTRVDQVEEILPMQTHTVKVPFSDVSGFELFTPVTGSQALVPLILGYDGADYIDPTTETDLVLYGKRFSILETQVVAGGHYLTRNPTDPEQSKMDIVSRDVMRVLLPSGLQPTLVRDGKQYVEVVVSTPNGVSNRFPIPYGPPSVPQATPEPLNIDTGYTLVDDLLKLAANVTPDPTPQGTGTTPGQAQGQAAANQAAQAAQTGTGAQANPGGNQTANAAGAAQATSTPKLTASPAGVARGTRIRIMAQAAPAQPSDTISADFRFPVPSSPDTVISVVVDGIPYQDNAYVIDETQLNDVFVPDLIAKLDGFGKLTGQSPIHDLTTKTILITPGGSEPAPKATTNQLHVSIELYVQKKATTPAPGASTPAANRAGATAPAPQAGAAISGTAGGATTVPAPTPAPAGSATGAGGAPAAAAVSARTPRPDPATPSIRRDPVVTRAVRGPVIDPPARARPLSGLGDRGPAGPIPASPGTVPGRPTPAPPLGPGRSAPARTAPARPSRRPADRPSANAPAGEPLPPLPADARQPRRSLISRIMGKD